MTPAEVDLLILSAAKAIWSSHGILRPNENWRWENDRGAVQDWYLGVARTAFLIMAPALTAPGAAPPRLRDVIRVSP